ncbi:TPA: hypothetical protein ACQ98W_003209, partial [Citrobacter braakii]
TEGFLLREFLSMRQSCSIVGLITHLMSAIHSTPLFIYGNNEKYSGYYPVEFNNGNNSNKHLISC